MTTRKEATRGTRRMGKARLAEMIETATVDAYSESEQTTGCFTVIDENPFCPNAHRHVLTRPPDGRS